MTATNCNRCQTVGITAAIDLKREGKYWNKYEANTNFGTKHYCVQECRTCKEVGSPNILIKLVPFKKQDGSFGWKPINPNGSEHQHAGGENQSATLEQPIRQSSYPNPEHVQKEMEKFDKVFGADKNEEPETLKPSLLEETLKAILNAQGTMTTKLTNIEAMLTRILDVKK